MLYAIRDTQYSIRDTHYAIRDTQYEQIIQNKPNLLDDKMNVSASITKNYENFQPFCRLKNKPNQTQFLTQNRLLFHNIGFVFHQKLL